MIAVFTKWTKNSSDSVSWPDTIEFGQFDRNNLPPGFSLELYERFQNYFMLGMSVPTLGQMFLYNQTQESAEGNKLNFRIFVSDEDYATYKSVSDATATVRDELINSMQLTRTVKLSRNDERILEILGKSMSFDEVDVLFNDNTLFE